MGLRAIAVVVVAFTVAGHGKIFKPVELGRELHSIGVSDWDIPSLVCLAHNASNLNTNHTGTVIVKSIDQNLTFHGIFGVPESWLDGCNLHVSAVLDDNVEDDVKCVLKNIDERLAMFDRTDYLGVLTHHIVDLNKCFNWWEHLPPYVISPNEYYEVLNCTRNTTNASATVDTHHSTHKPHPPVTTTCTCNSTGSSAILYFSLLFLNIILIVLCYILWVSLVQRRPSETVVSSNNYF